MDIKKITLHNALACATDDSVSFIAKKLKDHKDRRIFVVDAQHKLLGIITTTDLVYKTLADGKHDQKAEDVMVRNVKSVDVAEGMEKALDIMNELKTFTCPVTEHGKLIGIISYHDLVGHVLASIGKEKQ
ncbi:CBS domain-containing protein [Candidatus Pacearchaeota archaeon]|nr:CBS domain-containing protein [Candidatus Pacearchaeota archaeon]